MSAKAALRKLEALADSDRAKHSARFFKSGPGEYGEGDRFLGIPVPKTREVLREVELSLEDCLELLRSPWHEARLLAVLGMARLAKRASEVQRVEICSAYLKASARVNNWDLVDSSAEYVVGPVLGLTALQKLARSKLLWDRRIAMLATFHSIKKGAPGDALRIAEVLLGDREGLIHKAVGWMLREIGQRCGVEVLRGFLARHLSVMPRTALRYAIEKLGADERRRWMKG
jgi:3-methyladenine DNA glycosylase AlkD